MIELARLPNINRIKYFQIVLQENGIQSIVRNENMANLGLSNIPIVDFYPALFLLNADDYDKADKIIKNLLDDESNGNLNKDVKCDSCSEMNPANFDICWSCGGLLKG